MSLNNYTQTCKHSHVYINSNIWEFNLFCGKYGQLLESLSSIALLGEQALSFLRECLRFGLLIVLIMRAIMAGDLGAQLSEVNDLLKVQLSCFSFCLAWWPPEVLLSIVRLQILRKVSNSFLTTAPELSFLFFSFILPFFSLFFFFACLF